MILFRYLCREVYATLLATTLVLLLIFITNQFVHYLNDAALGKITTTAVMEVMSLQVPLLLGYLLPLGLFLGLLLTFGRRYVDHEMVVLSACGVSRAHIVKMVMLLSAVIMLVVAWLMMWVEPRVQWYRAKILTEAVATASLQKIIPGRFQPLGKDGKAFYAGRVMNDHHQTGDVFLAEKVGVGKAAHMTDSNASKAEQWDVVSAESATEVKKKGYDYVVFKKGTRYIGVPGESAFQTIQYNQYGIRLDNPKASFSERIEVIPTSKLWQQRHTHPEAAAELQWRFSMPISVMAFALLAVPLSRANPRKGKFAQMLPAILIYIVYANLMFMGRAWLKKGLISPELGLWWIHGLIFLLGIVLLLHQAGWRRVFNLRRR